VFDNSVSFNNRGFLQTAVFKGCTFTKAPEFHNCALHQDTDFDGAKFLDKSPDAARAYRTLKLAMENLRARQEEAMFYALEQRSRRAMKTTPMSVKAASWLYEKTASYGESYIRPLLGVVLTAVFFSLVYGVIAFFLSSPSLTLYESSRFALHFALDQLLRPFRPMNFNPQTLPAGITMVMRLAATLQSVTSLSFLALFLLALRRRFKMG
jgi:hypothetical protein